MTLNPYGPFRNTGPPFPWDDDYALTLAKEEDLLEIPF